MATPRRVNKEKNYKKGVLVLGRVTEAWEYQDFISASKIVCRYIYLILILNGLSHHLGSTSSLTFYCHDYQLHQVGNPQINIEKRVIYPIYVVCFIYNGYFLFPLKHMIFRLQEWYNGKKRDNIWCFANFRSTPDKHSCQNLIGKHQ